MHANCVARAPMKSDSSWEQWSQYPYVAIESGHATSLFHCSQEYIDPTKMTMMCSSVSRETVEMVRHTGQDRVTVNWPGGSLSTFAMNFRRSESRPRNVMLISSTKTSLEQNQLWKQCQDIWTRTHGRWFETVASTKTKSSSSLQVASPDTWTAIIGWSVWTRSTICQFLVIPDCQCVWQAHTWV